MFNKYWLLFVFSLLSAIVFADAEVRTVPRNIFCVNVPFIHADEFIGKHLEWEVTGSVTNKKKFNYPDSSVSITNTILITKAGLNCDYSDKNTAAGQAVFARGRKDVEDDKFSTNLVMTIVEDPTQGGEASLEWHHLNYNHTNISNVQIKNNNPTKPNRIFLCAGEGLCNNSSQVWLSKMFGGSNISEVQYVVPFYIYMILSIPTTGGNSMKSGPTVRVLKQ